MERHPEDHPKAELAKLQRRLAELEAAEGERERAERRARISARQWQATFDAISASLFLLDAGGRIVRCNEATVDFIGQPRTEIIGRQCCELVHKTSTRIEGCPYTRALETLERESSVWQTEDRWFEATVEPMLDEDDYLIGFVHLLEDITERKQAEEALRRRARELRLLNRAGQVFNASLELDVVLSTVLEEVRGLLDVAGCSIWLQSPETNELICRQVSGPQSDIVRGWRLAPGEGIAGWVLMHGKSSIVPDAQRDERHFEDVDQQTGLGLRSLLTVPLCSKESTIGVLQAVDEEVSRFNADDADLLESLAASATLAIEKAQAYERAQQEIAERRRAEAALRDAEARYRTLFEETPIGLYRTTPDGKVLEANPALATMLGYPDRESLLEVNAVDFYLDPEDRKRGLRAVEAADEWESVEVRLRRRNGQIIWVLDTGRAVRDAEGRICYYDGALEEITQRKLSHQALRQRADELAALQNTVLEIAAPHDLSMLLDAIVKRAVELLSARAGGMYLCEPERKEVCCVASYNTPEDYRGTALAYGEGAAGTVAQSGEPLTIDDYRTWSGRAEVFEEEGPFTAVLTVPMVWRDEVIGTLDVLDDVEDRRFTQADLELLGVFAKHAAIAVENARLHEDAQREISERKRVADALRESEERYRRLVETLNEGIWSIDAEGYTTYVNPRMAEMLGYTVEEMEGKHLFAFMDDEWAEEARAKLKRRRHGVTEQHEFTFRKKNGEPAYMLLNASPVLDEGGNYAGALAGVADITERKRAEEALRKSENRFRQLFEEAPIAYQSLSWDGDVTEVNQAWLDLLGYTREEAIGRQFHELIALDDQERFRECFAYFKAVGEIHDVEFEIVRKDGSPIVVSFDGTIRRGEEGRLERIHCTMHEITGRKQAEKALEQRVAELTLINEIGNQITRALGLETLLESAVQIVRRSFGYHNVAIFTLDQERRRLILRAIDGRFADVVPEDLQIDLDEGLIGWAARHAETMLVNDVKADSHYANHYPDQILRQSELSVPIRIADSVVGVLDAQSEHRDAFDENDVMVMETVADQIAVAMENARLYDAERAAREQLRHLASYLQDAREEERTHIAREIHDEFGQMMTVLRMDLSWLAKRLPTDRPELLQKANGMSDTIDETLGAVQRISSQLRPGILDDLGLAAAIEWQIDEFKERSGIVCELHLDREGDLLDRQLATALFRIFQEALTNVARHAEASGVRVDLDVTPEEATLTVQDDGRGITQGELTDGESLGLIGMRERGRALGGEVSFKGRPGEGTTVTVRIPRADR